MIVTISDSRSAYPYPDSGLQPLTEAVRLRRPTATDLDAEARRAAEQPVAPPQV